MHKLIVPSIPAMHIPDGFLSVFVSAIFWVISLLFLGAALRQSRKSLGERDVPLMGVLAAAIFAGQMLNFTIPGGTSGHLLGAALASILLGPWPAVLVMTAVVSVQALLFQDGGILALGANIFNLAVLGVFVSHAVYSVALRIFPVKKVGILASGFLAAWASIMASAMSAALQLALSGTSPADIAVPAMAAIHAIIGIGEGLITLGALAFISTARKDLLEISISSPKSSSKGILIGGGLLAVALAILSPLASIYPDGLEAVAEQKGFINLARDAAYNIFPDYTIPGLLDPGLTTIIAGFVGVNIVFLLVWGVARLEKLKHTSEQ